MEAKPHPHPAHHVPLSALHCTEHTVHSKVTALSQETSRGRFSSKMTSSHGYPNATELRKHTHLLWSHSLGLRRSVWKNTIILDLLQYRWEQNLALLWERESKVHIGFICLWSEADSFQYLRGLHLNHLWILKTTLLLGITSNPQFLDLLQLDSVFSPNSNNSITAAREMELQWTGIHFPPKLWSDKCFSSASLENLLDIKNNLNVVTGWH